MLKLLIVDDNFPDREGLKTLVDWASLGVGKIDFASNGLEGYQTAVKVKPDLILSDVSMPVMNGLVMAEKIKAELPSVKIIFMSCFDEKDYIITAIGVNAYGYVVKPISIEKLTASVKKALNATVVDKKKDEKLVFLEREITELMPLLKENFVRDLLYGNVVVEEKLEDRLLKMGLELRRYFTVVAVKTDTESFTEHDYVIIYKIKKMFESLAASGMGVRVCCFIQNYKTLAMLIYVDGAESMWDAQEQVILYLDHCREIIQDKMGNAVMIGIGHISQRLNDAKAIFKGVEASLDDEATSKTKRLILAEEIKGEGIAESGNIQELKEEIECLIDGRDMQSVTDFVDKYFTPKHKGDKASLKRLLFIMISIIQMILYERNESFGAFLDDELNVWRKALNIESILDIRQWIINVIKAVIEHFESKEKDYYLKLVESIKNIVDEEYAEISNITSVTERLFMSKNHASVIFKKYTGESIFDYLVKRRMQKAKQLLSDSTCKIGEISQDIGYKSNAYFTSVFKEYTGLTPKEYRYSKKPKANSEGFYEV